VFELGVGTHIQPTTVFGCREGVAPLLAGLIAAESHYASVGAIPERDAGDAPSAIAVTMPSGRVLTFVLGSIESTLPEIPQKLPAVSGPRRDG